MIKITLTGELLKAVINQMEEAPYAPTVRLFSQIHDDKLELYKDEVHFIYNYLSRRPYYMVAPVLAEIESKYAEAQSGSVAGQDTADNSPSEFSGEDESANHAVGRTTATELPQSDEEDEGNSE